MTSEVIATVATAINTVVNAAGAAKGIKGLIKAHPIAAVATTVGVAGVGTGCAVHGASIHAYNKANPNDMKNFFGRPKKSK